MAAGKLHPVGVGGHPVEFEFGSIRFQTAAFSEKGVRKQMEDEHLICPSLCAACPALADERDAAVIGIFDGHGGRQSATFVRDNLAIELGNQAALLPQDTVIPFEDVVVRKIIHAACQKLDSRIATEIPACKDGCTAVMLFIQGEVVYSASLGDAAAFLGMTMPDSTLHAVPITEAHKPWVISEKKRIIAAGGSVEIGRLNGVLDVSRSFGDISFKRFGVLCTPTLMKFSIDLPQSPFVVVGCDGFWASWTSIEAITFAKQLMEKEERRLAIEGCNPQFYDLKGICREMTDYVLLEKKSQDNVSVIMLRLLPRNTV